MRTPIVFEQRSNARGDERTEGVSVGSFPFYVTTTRPLTNEEMAKAIGVCKKLLGDAGGRIPDPEARWFLNTDRGVFGFKTESDMLVFVVAMTG